MTVDRQTHTHTHSQTDRQTDRQTVRHAHHNTPRSPIGAGVITVTESVDGAAYLEGVSVAEWLACWTQAQYGPGSNRSRDAVG